MAKGKEEELGDDFSYILRMADTDMDGLKPLSSALTSVKGIGVRSAIQICKSTGFDPARMAATSAQSSKKRSDLPSRITSTTPYWMVNRAADIETGNDIHLTGQEVKLTLEEDNRFEP